MQDSLSWLVDNYSTLAAWNATTLRLTSFNDSLVAAESRQAGLDVSTSTEASAGLALNGLVLTV